TTILSSMASGSDHIDHVKTQIPYAIFAGIIAICFGFLPAGFKIYNPLLILAGLILIILVIIFYGKKWESI
ncbi:MAG: Na+/H+ antiporter NhaC family protein, partial [Candidatus Marinimicrobia bacterium]|nr:Na+/H+ antiporter NhaC family protein [Candidatus Neomarinimicrobiota bacterium]